MDSLNNDKSKKNQNGSTSSMLAKLVFTPTAALQVKTQRKLQNIHSLSIAMLPILAAKRGFNGQCVTVITKTDAFPALLVLDKKLKENVAIIAESVSLDQNLCEGDEITVSSECHKLYAEEVSFCLLSNKELSKSTTFKQFLKEQLVTKRLIICSGLTIFLNYLSQEIILKVQNVKFFAVPTAKCQKIPFQCIWQTQIITKSVTESETKLEIKKINFEDIGGYQHELQSLQHQIDMLFTPVISNVKPVKGILISGPSGCGKSLIGEALKTKYGNKFISIRLEEVKSKFRGETEQRMKQFFTKALNRAPCLLFIDDLDVLCSSRDRGGDTGIVTALLHLMDGLGASNDGIIVIATAEKPQTLDAALRRPGRLSHDIVLSTPGDAARRDILRKLLVSVPSDIEESELTTLASNAHGYTGGDLRVVVMESIMQAEGRNLTKLDIASSLAAIKPAALRDSTALQYKVKLSDICGYDVIKSKLHEAISLTLTHGQVFQKCGIPSPSRFLLFGPPGCGKSSIIMAMAAEFHLHVIPVKRSTVLGKYFGESEQNLEKIFLQANDSSPCIIHFENFDGLAGRKNPGEDGGTDVEGRIINHLKVQLDGIVRNDGIFIFAETNRPDLLNKDVIRPGRFHEYYFVDLPVPEDRRLILCQHLLPCTFLSGVSLDILVEQTSSFSVTEILQLCEEMKIQSRGENEMEVTKPELISVDSVALNEALEVVTPNTSKKILQKHKHFASIYCS